MSFADLSQFNFALMLFNESPDSSGYPRKAFFNVTTAADKQALLDVISGLRINADKGNNASTGEAFYEAYQWFLGAKVHLGDKTATKHDSDAFSDSSKTRYVSPGLGCAKNHIIYLANGRPADNDNNALALLRRINPSAARTRIPVWRTLATAMKPTGPTNLPLSSTGGQTLIPRSKARRTYQYTRLP